MRSVHVLQLALTESVEEDRHQQRRHLFLGDLTAHVGVEDPRDRVVTEYAVVTFGRDDVNRGEVTH